MGFLKSLFGRQDPMDHLRKLAARKEWAGVLSAVQRLDRDALDDPLRAEVALLDAEAGDQLARLNLAEGRWARQNGELLKARDHYTLAGQQARSEELHAEVASALEDLASGTPVEPLASRQAPGHDCGSGCGPSGAPKPAAAPEVDSQELNEEERLELLLATLPADLAAQYLSADPSLRQAWLAAQEGDEARAGDFLEQVPEAGRGALFLAERGALLARRGDTKAAMRDLQAALALDAGLFPAFDGLVRVMAGCRLLGPLQQLLKQTLAEQRFVAYCWARLAELHAQRGEGQAALAAGLEALDQGENDPNLRQLCASLLEQEQRFDEAEAQLRRLPAGGCGGGMHPLLAEFLLRRGQQLDKALESFKGALRQERDNPRWPLRIAQVYQAKGWKKDAAAQLEPLLGRADLPRDLQRQVQDLADLLR